MVQEFHVLRCFACHTFQVQQVKKVNRWSCKVCGEKQSLLKEFGRGSAADCRRHVQKLNAMRGAMMEQQEHTSWSLRTTEEEEEEEDQPDDQVRPAELSRWNKYQDTPQGAEPEEEAPRAAVWMGREHLPGNKMIDRKRRRCEEEPDDEGDHTPGQVLTIPLLNMRGVPLWLPPFHCVNTGHCVKLHRPPPSTSSSPPGSAQVPDHMGPCGWRRDQLAGGATSSSNVSAMFPTPSMFTSSEDFSFDCDDFLSSPKL